MTVHAYDLNGDGVKELITGWSNGKVRLLSLIQKQDYYSSTAE